MFGILDVAIGLILVVTLVSLVCSVINEWISGILSKRGQMLWEGIYKLVGQDLADRICAHHLLQGLSRESWFDRLPIVGRLKRSKPSYVPTRLFVMALMDVVGQSAKQQAAAATTSATTSAPPTAGTFPTDLRDLRAAIEALPSSQARQALLALVDDAGGKLEAAKKNLGDWFDDAMNRVSGWYKRWSQLVLLAVSIIVALVLGVDILQIGKQLWADPALRQATAQAAERFVHERSPEPAAADQVNPAEAEEVPEAAADSANVAEASTPADATAPPAGEEPAAGAATAGDANAPPAAGGQVTAPAAEPGTEKVLAKDLKQDLHSLMGELQDLGLPLAPFESAAAEYERERPEDLAAVRAEWSAAGKDPAGAPGFWILLGFWLGQHGLGLLLTGLAASLGAPFWFDLLNKFVTLRASGKPPEPAKKEG